LETNKAPGAKGDFTMDLYNPPNDDATAPITVAGRQFSRRLKKLNAGQRAVLAYGLNTGALHLSTYTKPQSAALAEISVSYISTVAHASPTERDLLSYGWLKLSDLHNQKKRQSVTTDADIERMVVEIGFDRIMAVIDRLTAPVLEPAE
jgi:hypothetical protein